MLCLCWCPCGRCESESFKVLQLCFLWNSASYRREGMMNHEEIGRGDFVLLDEISIQGFIHNLRTRSVPCGHFCFFSLFFFSLFLLDWYGNVSIAEYLCCCCCLSREKTAGEGFEIGLLVFICVTREVLFNIDRLEQFNCLLKTIDDWSKNPFRK